MQKRTEGLDLIVANIEDPGFLTLLDKTVRTRTRGATKNVANIGKIAQKYFYLDSSLILTQIRDKNAFMNDRMILKLRRGEIRRCNFFQI